MATKPPAGAAMFLSGRAALLAAGLTAVLAGCAGNANTGHGLVPSSPAASGSATTTVHISAADSGRTFLVRRGTVLDVELAADGASYDPPQSDSATVLPEASHQGGYPSATAAVASFTAARQGTAHISSQTDLACLHATPRCLPPQRVFRVTVVVG